MNLKDAFEKYYALSLKFLSYRPRSEREVRDNLIKKNVPNEIIEAIVKTLKEQRFINDEEFAKMWVDSRNRSKPRSQRLLRLELKRKGIADEIIDQLTTKDQRPTTDLELAKKIVEKKIGKFRNLEGQEIYKKLGGLLARRGFDWDTIKHAIDESLRKEV